MTPTDRLLAKIDPLFKPPAFDERGLPPGFKPPAGLRALLGRRNGGYFWGGALHVFGACVEPASHSLVAWNGPAVWRGEYGEVADGLVFFAENGFGDQFGLDASGKVFELDAEQGTVEERADDFDQWLLMAVEATDELLSRPVFAAWVQKHGRLPYGSQLQAFPPFIFAESAEAVELSAVDALENMQFHATLARTIANLPEGSRVKVEFTDEGIQISTVEA